MLNFEIDYSNVLHIAILVVGALLLLVSIFALFVSIYLAIAYIKYNRTKNSIGLTGKEVARKILDDNGLEHIKVSATGSFIFGNSYSHYFKKVRLRRFTYKKQSISSLAMAAQKSSLAIMDKEGDPDMKKRVRLVPLITFGPLLCVPLIVVGVLLDVLLFNANGVVAIVFVAIGLLFYIMAFVLSIMVLKTEVKAQEKAYQIMRDNHLATEEELEMMKKLFKLYNIQYVNDLIIELLEIIYRVLQLVAMAQNGGSGSNSSK